MSRLFTFLLILTSVALFAQAPVNDDCNGIIDLGTAPVCDTNTLYTNVNATASDIGNFTTIPTCLSSGNSPHDVWFQFTAGTALDYKITVKGAGSNPLNTPQLVLYRGFCVYDELLIMQCTEAPIGEDQASINITGLTPGLTYFIRVGDYSPTATPNWGEFTLCIEEKTPEYTIDQDSSKDCSGIVYDTGGPDGDYGPNEDHTFTICPSDFHNCIKLSVDYYNIDASFGQGEVLSIYDGPDNTGTPIAEIGGFNAQGNPNEGGVCFQVYASSGCATLHFQSDADVQFEGFKVSWECTFEACPTPEPLQVSVGDSAAIVDYLNTPYSLTTVDSIDCEAGAYGAFVATDNTGLGLERGIVLTSGLATNAIGPNDSGSAGFDWPQNNNSNKSDGDADLDTLSVQTGNGTLSQDACIVYLDVFAFSDRLEFEYVFGSEEYKEYVGSFYNDIFAFLVSGPGIVGNVNGKKNIAVLPNISPEVPVQINSVNHVDNWQYFRDNALSQTLQYDGLTSDSLGVKKSLTASVNVIPCNHYKLKLAVADRGDGIFDSGVFVSEIKAGAPKIAVSFENGIDYLSEVCSVIADTIVIALDNEITDTVTYNVQVSGTATQGVDYNLNLPPTLTFYPGMTSYSFPLSVIDDNIQEGVETIIVSLSNDFGCGEVVFDDVIIEIKDYLDVEFNNVGDTLDVCIGHSVRLEASGAADFSWTPPEIFDDPSSPTPMATPTMSGWIKATGSLGTCTDTDSIYLNLVDVQITAIASDTTICLGDSVSLNAIPNVPVTSYQWSPGFWVSDPTVKTPTAKPQFTTNFTVAIEYAGCTATGTVTVSVDTLFEPVLIGDTTICLGQSVMLASPLPASTSTYQWNPATTLDDPNSASPVATPTDASTIYTLTTTSANGNCSTQQSVAVNTVPAALDVFILPDMSQKDTLYLCAPDSVNLLAQTSTAGAGLTWSPDNGTLSSLTDTIVKVTPNASALYVATLQVAQCILHDSLYIRYDSLPASLEMTAIPFKDPFCPGDTVSIFSPNYDQNAFPDIMHQWTPSTGVISDLDNFNLVVVTADTITYTRYTQNGACADSSSITINVEQPPNIEVTQDKDTICAGEQVQLTASSDQGSDFVWMPESGLSCTECPNPVATPVSTVTYSVQLQGANCPSNQTATIVVMDAPALQFPSDTDLCLGESVTLNTSSDTAYTYVWTADDPNFDTLYIAAPTVTPAQTTTYTVVVSNGNCTRTESVTIHVADDNLTIEGPNGVCPGFPVTLTAVTNGSGSYLWTPGDLNTQSINVEPASPTTYTVTYTYGDGCVLTASHDLTVYQAYQVEVTAEKDTVYSNEVTNLHASVSPSLSNPVFKWTQNGNVVGGSGPDLAVNATDGPIDEYVVTLTTPDGCEYSAAISVVVLPLKYEIPNAFTPNGDGINETFRPAVLLGYELKKMKVFDRWGQLVYESTSGFKGWDGTFKGKEMPSDAYPYFIELKAPNGNVETIKGNVTLIR